MRPVSREIKKKGTSGAAQGLRRSDGRVRRRANLEQISQPRPDSGLGRSHSQYSGLGLGHFQHERV